jgi:TPP-dependent 2-oxoacid decarboxylase
MGQKPIFPRIKSVVIRICVHKCKHTADGKYLHHSLTYHDLAKFAKMYAKIPSGCVIFITNMDKFNSG